MKLAVAPCLAALLIAAFFITIILHAYKLNEEMQARQAASGKTDLFRAVL